MAKLLLDFIIALGICVFIYPVGGEAKLEVNVTINANKYEPPGNVKFPLCDEEPPANTCNENMIFPEIDYPPCTSDEDCPDPHIPCDQFEQNHMDSLVSCCEGKIIPETKCVMCNLNIPPSGAPGILIKCRNCTDASGCCKKIGRWSCRDTTIHYTSIHPDIFFEKGQNIKMANSSELDYTDKLVFVAEWYDYERSHQKNFYFHYFPFDNTVELYDIDLNRVYLRRAICEGLSFKDMFVGNTVRVYGRQLNIVDYGDVRTKKLISKKNERTLALFKPSVIKDLGTIITFIIQKNFKFMKMKMCNLTRAEALEFYDNKKGDSFLPFLIEQLISGPVIAVDLVGEDAVNRWKSIMGPRDPSEARSKAPESLRAIYGHELASNGFHGADTVEDALKESNFFFPRPTENKKSPKSILLLKNTTCCIIKPHAVDSGSLGNILNEIMNNGFKITSLEIFYLSNANADEFLEVYKGVVSDFNALMLSFIDGPLVAMEIAGKDGSDVHGDFRKFTGPFDPEIARQIRPNTLRAKFGIDKYRNAIHCTDLAEDTNLELEYFFRILQD